MDPLLPHPPNACLSLLFKALTLHASALVTEYKNDAISEGVAYMVTLKIAMKMVFDVLVGWSLVLAHLTNLEPPVILG